MSGGAVLSVPIIRAGSSFSRMRLETVVRKLSISARLADGRSAVTPLAGFAERLFLEGLHFGLRDLSGIRIIEDAALVVA